MWIWILVLPGMSCVALVKLLYISSLNTVLACCSSENNTYTTVAARVLFYTPGHFLKLLVMRGSLQPLLGDWYPVLCARLSWAVSSPSIHSQLVLMCHWCTLQCTSNWSLPFIASNWLSFPLSHSRAIVNRFIMWRSNDGLHIPPHNTPHSTDPMIHPPCNKRVDLLP